MWQIIYSLANGAAWCRCYADAAHTPTPSYNHAMFSTPYIMPQTISNTMCIHYSGSQIPPYYGFANFLSQLNLLPSYLLPLQGDKKAFSLMLYML